MIFGWIIGSKQVRTYIHLSGAQVEQAYKKLYGLQDQEKVEQQLIKCQICGENNDMANDTCEHCYNPLTIQGALKIKQQNQLLEQDRDISQKVFAEAIKLVNQQGLMPEDAQLEAVKVIAKQQVQQQTIDKGDG